MTADLGIPTLKREEDEVTLRDDLERGRGGEGPHGTPL